MYSQHDSRKRRIAALGHGLAVVLIAAGCATPPGEVFPRIIPARVWPPSPEPARVRLVGTIADSHDLSAGKSGAEKLAAIFRGSRPPIAFSRPSDVAVSGARRVAVADSAGAALHVLDIEARTHVVVFGWEGQRLVSPIGVTWADGNILVSDAARGEVVEFAADGKFVRAFGGSDLKRPVGLDYNTDRREIYIVDGGDHVVKVLDRSGQLRRTIGSASGGQDALRLPTYLRLAGDVLFVADSGRFRVVKFTTDGRFLAEFGEKGDGAGDFALPKGIAVDSAGHVYVVDAQFENVQVFDEQGQLLLAFGGEGRGLGEFWLPAGLWIDEMDRIWVADSGNRRLQVFEYLGDPS